LAFNTRKNLLYVPYGGNQVSIISDLIDGGSVVGAISTNPFNHLIAINETTQRGYVSLSSPASVAVLDVASNSVLIHIPISGAAGGFGIALNETTNRIYIAHNSNENSLTVIDGATNSIITQIAVGNGPTGIAVNELNNHIYVANYLDNTLSIIDGITNTVIQTLTVGDGPHAVTVNPNTAKVYVANRYSNTVTVIQDGAPPTQEISPPTNLSASAGVSSIALEWEASLSSNVAGYRVYRSVSATGTFTQIADAVQTTNYVDTASLTVGTTYYYYVTAYNALGEESTPSNIASAAFGQLELWIPNIQGNAGTTATVPINISNADGLNVCALDIAVTYTPSVVVAQSAERTALTAGYGFSANTTTPGTVRVALASGSGTPLYGSGTFVNLVVNVAGADGASTPLEFVIAQTDIYDCGDLYNPVNLTLTNGSFTVGSAYVKGDINGDGNVNSADAALALQIAAGLIIPTDIQLAAGDVNGDMKINSADASLILYYAANGEWPDVFGSGISDNVPQATAATLLSFPSVQGQPGSTVNVALSASNVSGMAGADLALSYDANILDVVGVTRGALTNGFSLATNTKTPGLVRFSLSTATGISSGTGTLATIQFRVKSSAAKGASSPLTLTQARLNAGNGLDFATSALQRPVQRQNGKVTVASTVTKTLFSAGTHDGWILESSENSNKGGTLNSTATTFNLGDDKTKKQYRGILSFATGAGLPDTAVITKVTLKVKKQGITGGGNPVTMFQGFMADVKKGYFGTAATLQAADFQALLSTTGKTYGPVVPALVSGWYTIDLTTVKAYINKTDVSSGLTQIRLRFKVDDNNNAIANYMSFYSGNNLTAPNSAYRPQLIIQYYVP
jgi:YVTN family beta-propeller protein